MSRFINPVPEYRPNSKLYFFKSGTNSPLTTHNDQFELTPNTHPVLTDSAGYVPNIFYSVSAKLVVLDENDVQYIERDPVGGEVGLGNFTLWDTVVTYGKGDIVIGSDEGFYISLSAGNQGNDPTIDPTSWEEIRFIGVWNTNITYNAGEVVQTPNGSLWKALTTTAANDPLSDDGTNWLPSIDSEKIPEIIALDWVIKAVDFTAVDNESYQIDGSSNTVDITLPTLIVGKSYTFHNEKASTFKVQVLNPSYTINGPSGIISPGTDIELATSNSVQLVAKSTTILEIVGAQV